MDIKIPSSIIENFSKTQGWQMVIKYIFLEFLEI